MRICIQSGTPLGTSDIYKPYYDSLKRHAQRVCRPDAVDKLLMGLRILQREAV